MKNFLAIIGIVLLGTVLYALTLRGIPGNPTAAYIKANLEKATTPFESSHERAPYAQLLAIVEQNRFDLTMELADLGAPDVGYYKGKFYSFFPPGITFIAIPFYQWGSQFGYGQLAAYAGVSLFSVLTLPVLFLIGRQTFKFPMWAALFVPLVYGFASTSWSYAITIYQHSVSTSLMSLAFYSAWRYSLNSKFSFLWGCVVWFCYGISIFIDYPNAILLLPIMVYFFFSAFKINYKDNVLKFNFRFSIILASLFFILAVGLHGYYNQVNYGDWKKFSNTFARYERDKLDLLLQRVNASTNIGLGKDEEKVKSLFQEDAMPRGVHTLLVADDKGIFFFSPIFILGVFGIFLACRKFTMHVACLVALVLINLFLYSSFRDPWGGWAYGPRYLIPSMAILSIFVSYFLVHTKYRLISLIVAIFLFVYSSAIALLGALTTNIVPPAVEAIPLKMKYNYFFNLDIFKSGQSGSFVFNQYASQFMDLQDYFVNIYILLLVLCIGLLVWGGIAKRHVDTV